MHELIKKLLLFSGGLLIVLGACAFLNINVHANPNTEALSSAYAIRGQNYIDAFNKGGGHDFSLLNTAQDAINNSRKYAGNDDNSDYQSKMAKIDNDLSVKLTLINAAKDAFDHNSQGEQAALQQAGNLSRNSDFNSDSGDSSDQEDTNNENDDTYSNADYDNGIDGYWQHNNFVRNRGHKPFDELLPGHTYKNYDELYIHQGDLDHYTKPADQVPSTFNYNLSANGSNTKFYGSDDNGSYLYFSINPDNPNELDVNGDGFYRHYYRTSKRDGYRDMHIGNSLVNRLNREYQQWLNRYKHYNNSYKLARYVCKNFNKNKFKHFCIHPYINSYFVNHKIMPLILKNHKVSNRITPLSFGDETYLWKNIKNKYGRITKVFHKAFGDKYNYLGESIRVACHPNQLVDSRKYIANVFANHAKSRLSFISFITDFNNVAELSHSIHRGLGSVGKIFLFKSFLKDIWHKSPNKRKSITYKIFYKLYSHPYYIMSNKFGFKI